MKLLQSSIDVSCEIYEECYYNKLWKYYYNNKLKLNIIEHHAHCEVFDSKFNKLAVVGNDILGHHRMVWYKHYNLLYTTNMSQQHMYLISPNFKHIERSGYRPFTEKLTTYKMYLIKLLG